MRHTKILLGIGVGVGVLVWLVIININANASNWSDDQIAGEGVYLTLSAIDMCQTITITKKPDKYFESWNIILPEHPSKKAVIEWFVAGDIVHFAIASILTPPYRNYWIGGGVSVEAACVINNHQLGVKMTVPFK